MDPLGTFVFGIIMCALSWLSGYWIGGGNGRNTRN